jgi:hypothetical protein
MKTVPGGVFGLNGTRMGPKSETTTARWLLNHLILNDGDVAERLKAAVC